MTTTSQDDELTRRLRRATETIDGPVPTAALVRRGRATVRRRRAIGTAATMSVLGAAWAVGAGTGVLGHRAEPHQATSFADAPSAFTSSAVGSAVGSTAAAPECDAHGKLTSPGDQRFDDLQQLRPALDGYRDLLVEHLDPNQRHLQAVDNVQDTGAAGCVLTSLGTKLGWKVPGEVGLGVVQVEVTSSWDDSHTHLAHAGWQPASSLPDGAAAAYVAAYDGGTAVAVTRTDGTTVALDAARLFGNNTSTPVTDLGLTTDQLLAAAADPAFRLP